MLNVLKQKTSTKNPKKRHGRLLVDEMKLSVNLYVTPSGHIEGFVELGPRPILFCADQELLCDHGMVIMLVPFMLKWTELLAAFGTRANLN